MCVGVEVDELQMEMGSLNGWLYVQIELWSFW